jgi:2-dehydro-3-deoxyphosphooctonate aldolase (KDO 8-P synthase)
MREVTITDDAVVGEGRALLVVGGPCVIESRQLCIAVAERLREVCRGLGLPYVFKASYDKANRTSISSFRGIGLEEGLRVLAEVRQEVGVPVLTDVHEPGHVAAVAEVVDVVQVPAFLCRQTDLIVAAARTGLPVNIKKGQFAAPEDMARAAEKVISQGNERVILCERGSCFGYNELVVDMRSIPRMQAMGHPVLFDATHATQRPAGLGFESGGDRDAAPVLAAAAVAAGADGVFLETHPDPDRALCDGATMLQLDAVEPLLGRLRAIAELGRPG